MNGGPAAPAPFKELGFTNISDNAKPGQGSTGTVGTGLNTGMADTSSGTTDMSKDTADTTVMASVGGTVESGGING